jgi:hypothetical protein
MSLYDPGLVRCRTSRLGGGLVAATLLCGCLGDPPPDPEVQPLEIVVGTSDSEFGPCVLNVDEVAAGTHEVVPVATAGSATVRILDPSGATLFERALEVHPAEGGGLEVPAEDGGSVRLGEGTHRVECIASDGTHTAELSVVPARPGYEDDGAR